MSIIYVGLVVVVTGGGGVVVVVVVVVVAGGGGCWRWWVEISWDLEGVDCSCRLDDVVENYG